MMENLFWMIPMGKKGTTPEYKQRLKNQHIILYLFSCFLKVTMNYQNELFELMEISTTYLNQTNSEMYKISIKTKQAWT